MMKKGNYLPSRRNHCEFLRHFESPAGTYGKRAGAAKSRPSEIDRPARCGNHPEKSVASDVRRELDGRLGAAALRNAAPRYAACCECAPTSRFAASNGIRGPRIVSMARRAKRGANRRDDASRCDDDLHSGDSRRSPSVARRGSEQQYVAPRTARRSFERAGFQLGRFPRQLSRCPYPVVPFEALTISFLGIFAYCRFDEKSLPLYPKHDPIR